VGEWRCDATARPSPGPAAAADAEPRREDGDDGRHAVRVAQLAHLPGPDTAVFGG
jgi:hypothetical protein